MTTISVVSSTQKIYVDPYSRSVAVINAGPRGPGGGAAGGGGSASIDDSITALDFTWSSSKIDSEIDTNINAAVVGLGLGTVAIENTVPITKGGTGATSQAAARTALAVPAIADLTAVSALLAALAATSPAFIQYNGTNYPARSTVTTDSNRMVIWKGPENVLPPIGGAGGAINGVDVFFSQVVP